MRIINPYMNRFALEKSPTELSQEMIQDQVFNKKDQEKNQSMSNKAHAMKNEKDLGFLNNQVHYSRLQI